MKFYQTAIVCTVTVFLIAKVMTPSHEATPPAQAAPQPPADPRASYQELTLTRIAADGDGLAAKGVKTSGVLFYDGKTFFLREADGGNVKLGADLSIIGADPREKIIRMCQQGCPVEVSGMVDMHGGILIDEIKG